MKIENLQTIYAQVTREIVVGDWSISYYLTTDEVCTLMAQIYLTSDMVKSSAIDFDNPSAALSVIWTFDKISVIKNDQMYGYNNGRSPILLYQSLEVDIHSVFTIIELCLNAM